MTKLGEERDEPLAERRARRLGVALAWWLTAQAVAGNTWLSRFSEAGRLRVLGRELWLIDGLIWLWLLALPLGVCAALVVLMRDREGPARGGAQGLMLGLLSMLGLGSALTALGLVLQLL